MPPIKENDTVAVTGANGFIGSHVIKFLIGKNFKIRACVRSTGKNDCKVEHLKKIGGSNITFFTGCDLEVEGSFDEAFKGANAVVHTAARVHERWSNELISSHVQGTKNVVKAAKNSCSVTRFIQTSSIAAIIDPFKYADKSNGLHEFDEKDCNTTTDPNATGDFYGYAKKIAEEIALEAGNDKDTGFDTVVINPSVVIGECLCKQHTKASPVFIRQMLYGNEQPLIYFSWVDAEDVAEAHYLALVTESETVAGERFIISNDWHGTVEDVAISFAQKVNMELANVVITPGWKNYLYWIMMTNYEVAMLNNAKLPVSNNKAKTILKMKFKSMLTSVKTTVDSMISNGWVKLKN